MDVFSRYCSRVGVMTQTDIVSVDQRFHVTQGIQFTETPLKIWAPSNSRKKSYRPLEPVLWSCRWNASTDVVGV